MAQKTTILTLRITPTEAKRIDAVRELTQVDKATLLREFVDDGLRRRVLAKYREGEVTAQRAAEILDLPLRLLLDLLEKEGIEINWDDAVIRDYMKMQYEK